MGAGVDVQQHTIWDEKSGVTAVEVQAEHALRSFEGVGAAKCHPTDQYDANIGLLLATSRAYRDLAVQIEASLDSSGSDWNGLGDLFRELYPAGEVAQW